MPSAAKFPGPLPSPRPGTGQQLWLEKKKRGHNKEKKHNFIINFYKQEKETLNTFLRLTRFSDDDIKQLVTKTKSFSSYPVEHPQTPDHPDLGRGPPDCP